MTDETCPDCGARMRRDGVLLNGRLIPHEDAEPYCPNAECGDIDTNEETT